VTNAGSAVDSIIAVLSVHVIMAAQLSPGTAEQRRSNPNSSISTSSVGRPSTATRYDLPPNMLPPKLSALLLACSQRVLC
jgi:hypothetical protein